MAKRPLDRALSLLGPLEGRIMRVVWSREVGDDFVVQDVREHMPELAYTTVMSTVARLADKGLLVENQVTGRRAYRYRASGTPTDFLTEAGRRQVREVLDTYGDVALAAFARHVDGLTARQRERLRKLSDG